MSKNEKKTSVEVKKKITAKPKISLDSDVLKAMNEHYSSYLGEEVTGRECFSAPDMDSHICNIMAREDGGRICSKCGNVPSRPCETTCDVHYFCLAAYAVRLGIGVTNKRNGVGAVKYNLRSYKYKDFYNEVIERHKNLQLEEVAEARESIKTLNQKDENNEKVNNELLLTYSDAAVLLGCLHTNVAGHVQRKDLTKVKIGVVSYVKKAEVLELCKKLKKDSK